MGSSLDRLSLNTRNLALIFFLIAPSSKLRVSWVTAAVPLVQWPEQ